MQKHLKRTGIVLLVLVLAFLVYALPYYHVQDLPANDAEDVTVSYSTGLITYDGPGEDRALIFYPGAKVAEEAYGWMMEQLAENGIDCYLVHMPLHFAIFGKNKAEDIIDTHAEYEHWIMAGHSLGGAMAASFAGNHQDEVDGLVLLASYSTAPLEDMKVLSVYGSLDGVLNRESYAKYMQALHITEIRKATIRQGSVRKNSRNRPFRLSCSVSGDPLNKHTGMETAVAGTAVFLLVKADNCKERGYNRLIAC